MAKVLVVDTDGLGLGLCMLLMKQGNDVQYFYEEVKDVGQGLVKKITNVRSGVKWADVVIHTMCDDYMDILDKFRSDPNKIIWATSEEGSKLELDRNYALKAIESIGAKIIPYEKFNDYDKGIKYLTSRDKRVVIKPCGKGIGAELTYISKNAEDAIFRLNKWKEDKELKEVDFIIQDFVEGIEVGVETWFTPKMGFCKHVFEMFEFKSLMNDKKGPSTGEQGTVGHYTTKSLLAEKVLYGLEDYLRSVNHFGTISVSCIIDKNGDPRPLEISSRLGWPATPMMLYLQSNDIIPWITAAANGKDTLKVSNEVATVVVLSQPPYPYFELVKINDVSNVPITIPKDVERNVYLHDAKGGNSSVLVNGKMVSKPSILTAGVYIATVTSSGATVSDSQKSVYDTINKIQISSNIMYRTDIGSRLESELPKLHNFGYCTDLEYGDHFEYRKMYEGYKHLNRSMYVNHMLRESHVSRYKYE